VGGGVTTQYHTTGGVLQGWWSVIDGCTQLVLLGRQGGGRGGGCKGQLPWCVCWFWPAKCAAVLVFCVKVLKGVEWIARL
jgi:hypothetical protein